MQISGHMVLKRVNWVHNIKNIGVTLIGKWSFVSLRNPWISVFDVVLLKVELEMWFLQFLSLNLPENCSFQTKIHSFYQKPRISVKIHGFHQNPQFLAFLSELSRGQHQIGILCETKDHLPRKVTPIFFSIVQYFFNVI